ncbi:MAG: transketolase [Alphaproteobacteria bacterium]|nr:transketolase [Alphaproteobacteria bacterium]MBF0332058.1 transketolase [Alphaproteobacteria bacterium]
MVMTTKRGHVPSSFSCAEILVSLFYGGVARYTRGDPTDPNRDRVYMSKGHAAHALYPILADIGYFPTEELARYTKPEGLLRMYADPSIPGIEAICGSLGHGLGIAAGVCMASRNDGRDVRSFVVLGDGECYEGSVWETAMFAAQQGLDNLVAIVDRNALCILGRTEDLVRLEPIDEKWRSFGWEVVRVDGHSHTALLDAFARVGKTGGKPLCIVADTVKGKGVSFMEGRSEWHNRMPSPEQLEQARRDLETNRITN